MTAVEVETVLRPIVAAVDRLGDGGIYVDQHGAPLVMAWDNTPTCAPSAIIGWCDCITRAAEHAGESVQTDALRKIAAMLAERATEYDGGLIAEAGREINMQRQFLRAVPREVVRSAMTTEMILINAESQGIVERRPLPGVDYA